MDPAWLDTQDGDTATPNDLIGWNFVNNTNNPMDDEGHGTFTAGEIGEMTNNAIGGAGLVWNAQIMPVEFLDSSGNGTDTAAAAGDRLRGRSRRQGHQRQLGCGAGPIPRSQPRSSTPTSTA